MKVQPALVALFGTLLCGAVGAVAVIWFTQNLTLGVLAYTASGFIALTAFGRWL